MRARFLFFVLLFCIPAVMAYEIPAYKGMVTDYTDTLTAEQVISLENKLRGFRDNSSVEIAVLIISTVGGEDFQAASINTAMAWGVGDKEEDNGILMFIAKEDREMRIEVGYGLEGKVPDGLAGEIIRDDILPFFKEDKYFDGVDSGVDSLIRVINGEGFVTFIATPSEPVSDFPWIIILIIGGVVIGLVILFASFDDDDGGSSGVGGAFIGGLSGGSGSSGSSGFGGFGGGSFGGGGAGGKW